MRRRQFMTLLGGAVAVWPVPLRAQHREEIRRVGILMGLEADDPEGASELKALKRAFQELGWVDGRNLQLEVSWSGGEPDRIPVMVRLSNG
jgi:putative ABC transport system substrate-binding protein